MLEIVAPEGYRDNYKIIDWGPFRVIEFDCLMCNVEPSTSNELYAMLCELNEVTQRATRRTMSLDLGYVREGIIVIRKNRTVAFDPLTEQEWGMREVTDSIFKILMILDVAAEREDYYALHGEP